MVRKQAIAKNIGLNLKRVRNAKGLSMQALATLAEIEKSQIVRIETGRVDCKVSTLYILSTALEIDICEFFKAV